MSSNEIKFNDGAAYERYMGVWSQLVGQTFLDWLTPKPGRRWLDVGCGNGAFTELITTACAPRSVHGIDPSEEQLVFARTRPATPHAVYEVGDAMALPYPDDAFDVSVMPLVIFFVPEPLKGVKEMARVTSPGGAVTAYAWDMHGGGFPYAAVQAEMRNLGVQVPSPPSPEASKIDAMCQLWADAGLVDIEAREIVVQRTFASFDEFWTIVQGGPSMVARLAAMSAGDTSRLIAALRERLPADANGHITYSARAHAIKGKVPA